MECGLFYACRKITLYYKLLLRPVWPVVNVTLLHIAITGGELVLTVESRCGAVALGLACLFPSLSFDDALIAFTYPRFHTPLIEPDKRSYRIRLSDKMSRFRPRIITPQAA